MFSSKTKDVVTLFHKASSPASMKILRFMKQTSALTGEVATEDQASDHTPQNKLQRAEFDLDVSEAPPTPDQLRSILDYIGDGNASKVVKGAAGASDALNKLKSNADLFQRPLTVDWNNGKAVAGDNESEIIKMLNAKPDQD